MSARHLGVPPRVAVRVNPDFELKSSGMKMGGGPKQFGVDAERVPAVLAESATAASPSRASTSTAARRTCAPDAICEAQQKTSELAIALAAHAPAPVRVLNLGGGFGIPYFPGERAARPRARSARNLGELSLERSVATCPQATLVIELGRYLVGEAGVYVCRVVDRKVSRGQVFLVTDGGLHHHLAASGNFGQVIRKNYPVAIGNRIGGDATRERVGRRAAVHAARPARRPDGTGRGARTATWSSCSSRAPTDLRRARLLSSVIRPPSRCWYEA